ncbi:MAG: glyoxalase/bleomycin resistance/extradiol dioxygenase family protein [Actinomycetia bacterium]|jgi:catechol 2,3-dioxygenase-like lactoylglutathione lyase family enzyme|nr:glyoxalase/bleomycin resistance/extradiol dioxygenase family protein [Actinomycetes bacterium]
MLDHVGLNVKDYAASRAFYEQALAPLGWRVLMSFDEWNRAGFGTAEKPEFWISQREPYGTGTHVAFASPDRATVDAFHGAALAAGGRDNGAPGVREIYHPNYYGAFVLDADGNNIEAVCHAAP